MLLPYYNSENFEAGTDEAGRGCLAGPVTAAAFISPPPPEGGVTKILDIYSSNFEIFRNQINDSKQLSEKKRDLLRPIIEQSGISFAVTHIYPDVIDEINILNASLLAMQKCVLKLDSIPIYIIVDGNCPLTPAHPTLPKGGLYNIRTPQTFRNGKNSIGLKKVFHKFHTQKEIEILNSIPNIAIVKGDEKYLSIAAASILAKTHRDEYMNRIHEEFPMYNWAKNKGYPTKEHREAIKEFGITKYHRKSFRLLPDIDLFQV
jgi:ribonuclease HII